MLKEAGENKINNKQYNKDDVDLFFNKIESLLTDNAKEIDKLKEEIRIEKANLRANYFLSIFILFTYIFIEMIGSFTLFGQIFTKLSIFISVAGIFILFYIKDIVTYSTYIVSKYFFKIL